MFTFFLKWSTHYFIGYSVNSDCPPHPPQLGNSLYTYVCDSLSKWNKIIENKPPIVQTVSLCIKNWSRLTSSSLKSTVTQVIVIWSGLYHTKIDCIVWYPEKKNRISWVSIFSFKAQYSSIWFGGGGGFWVFWVWVFFCFLAFLREGKLAYRNSVPASYLLIF